MVPWKSLVVLTFIGTAGYLSLMAYLSGTNVNSCIAYGDYRHPAIRERINATDAVLLQHDVDVSVSFADRRQMHAETWIPVSNARRMFVYSAFYDYSLPDRIRVIGIMETYSRVRPWCLVTSGNSTFRTRADVVNINEEHGKRFTAAYFLCYVCGPLDKNITVSIVDGEPRPTHALHVHFIPPSFTTRRHMFTLCLSPFNKAYNNIRQLTEWVEMNRIFGVTYFTLYNFSTSPLVQDVLRYYASIGLASVLQWNIDVIDGNLLGNDSSQSIHNCGQLAAINDCLYRNKRLTKYLAIVDVDELIVPRQAQDYTWTDMFTRLPNSSVYTFRNTFFHSTSVSSALTSSNRSTSDGCFLYALTALQREEISAVGERSKLIVRTNDVVTLGIHEVWSLNSVAGRRHAVPPLIGLLHHYRTKPTRHVDISKLIEDKTMNKYDKVLRHSVFKSIDLRDRNVKGCMIDL